MTTKNKEDMDIIAQLATTSLSSSVNSSATIPYNRRHSQPEQRNYNFVSVGQQQPRSESLGSSQTEEDSSDEYEEEEEGDTQNRTRKVNYACTECRKAHKACSGGRPCERCSKLGLSSKCKSSTRKKRILTKKYWFEFLQQQQAQQQGGNNGPRQPIFVDHFAVENMKQQLESRAAQRQKQFAQTRTTETFQFSTYVPPMNNMPGNAPFSPRQDVQSPRTDTHILSPRQELYSSPRSGHSSPRADPNNIQSPRMFLQQGYQQQQQTFINSPRLQQQQHSPRVDQLISPRMQQIQLESSPRMQPLQQQSPRFNAIANQLPQTYANFENIGMVPPQGLENVGANVYQSPRMGTGISPRITEQNSPRLDSTGIVSPRLVEQNNIISPRTNVQYSPRIEQLSNSPRVVPNQFSPRNSYNISSTSLENYKIGRPNAVISPQQQQQQQLPLDSSLPSMQRYDEELQRLESISELTKKMEIRDMTHMQGSNSPRFVQYGQQHQMSPLHLQQQIVQQQQNQFQQIPQPQQFQGQIFNTWRS